MSTAGPGDTTARGLLAKRPTVVADASPGTHGSALLAKATDKAVSVLAEAAFADCEEKWAVVALGAYGAGRLLPFSDIDLLLLSELPQKLLKPCVERLLYPLWDAGLEVGHQVRSRSDHIKQSTRDLEILTSSLTGRFLAGNRLYAEETLGEVARRAGKRRRSLLEQLEKRPRPGSPYLLEPDLKEGTGGQRDIDELVWRAAIMGAAPAHDVSALEGPGILAHDAAERLSRAQDVITAARWRLHSTARRKTSRLSSDMAEEVASAEMHRALADVDGIVSAVRAGTAGQPTEDWDLERVFSALSEGVSAAPSIETAAGAGRLDSLIPGFSDLMNLRRPGLGHRYTVGAHMLRTAAMIAEIDASDPLAAAALRSLSDRRPLLAAALTHDAGKLVPGPGHAERGVPAVRELSCVMGLDARSTALAETLVREHLLLAETAATSDTDDDDVVLNVASRVGDSETLGALYVLTAADSLATGPGAWTRWHAVLIGSLVTAVDGALREPGAAGIADRGQLVRIEALESLPARSALAPIVRAMPYRYLNGRTPSTVVAEVALVAEVDQSGTGSLLATRIAAGPLLDSYSITVAVPDRPGVFATVAGCLTLSGLDILEAEVHSIGAIALDTFVVASATAAAVEPHTWSRFERELRAALGGNLALETRLAERRGHYDRIDADTSLSVETETGPGGMTRLIVIAPDRVGLLHDIAAEVTRAGLRITRARALVRESVVHDVFFLTDEENGPAVDPGVLGHLAMGIRERCR